MTAEGRTTEQVAKTFGISAATLRNHYGEELERGRMQRPDAATNPNGAGGPAHEPTIRSRAEVMMMAGLGDNEEDIAKYLAISAKTLRKHYRIELETGHIRANSKVKESLFKAATDPTVPGHVTAGIWWTKTRCGWREQVVQQVDVSIKVSLEAVKVQLAELLIKHADARSDQAGGGNAVAGSRSGDILRLVRNVGEAESTPA